MLFRYVAYNLKAGIVRGRLEARAPSEAQAILVGQGLKPLEMRTSRQGGVMARLFPSLYHVGSSEIIRFCRNMATMLTTGGDLVRVLEMLHRETRQTLMRRTVEDIRRTLDEGGSFSEALAAHPTVFSPLFISVVEVGEHTGRLGPALEEMAEILQKETEAKQKAIRTLLYPMAIMALSVLTMVVLMLFAMPPMMKVFERMGAKLPLVTRLTISFFNGVKENALVLALSFVSVGVAITLARRVPVARYWLDVVQTKLPLYGSLLIAKEMAQISRTLAMLLDSGVPLANALQLSRGACKNLPLRRAFEDAEEHLLSGHRLAEALAKHSIVPTMFVELVTIGEESNSLRRTMNDAASTYQKQLEQRLNGLLGMLEPLSTVFVGGIVALIAFSMFVPIYASLNSFK
ncbi:MAG: type II secretion system F family protein [Chloroflexi bacterium]|nr:type II secretion system F family protein [Chloroflexota bacterium]